VPLGIGIWELLILACAFLVFGVPAFVVGKRSRVPDPGIAFIPFVGAYIVLLRASRISAWWTFLVLIPYLGALALDIWIAVMLPRENKRDQWWTFALVVPGVNIVGYWIYAFTLRERDADLALPAQAQLGAPPPPPASQERVSGAAAPTSAAAQIGQLAALHQQGALTDSEFAAAKASLLASQQE